VTPTIRIDDEVLNELKKRAKDLDLVFEPPNATLRIVLGLDSQPAHQSKTVGSALLEEDLPKKATSLVIHAPWHKEGGKPGEPYSLETYLETGVGKGYAISQNELSALTPGSRVIVLRNDREKRRVEGTFVDTVRTNKKTSQGIQRYDVLFKDQMEVDYSYNKPQEKLTRRGVKVIDY
jgi:hypothetical protein